MVEQSMKKVSRDEMAEIDRIAPEDYGITISRMMENAAYQIAEFVRKEIDGKQAKLYAGKGNNGGDALATARRLKLWDYDIEVILASKKLDGIRKEELEILKRLGVEYTVGSSEKDYEVAVEGLIGYNLKGDPRDPFDSLIEEVNSHNTVVSIDIASGLEADTGERSEYCVRPDFTVSLAAPFEGMDRDNSGEIWLADIGVPPEAYDKFGFTGDFFEEESLIRIDSA